MMVRQLGRYREGEFSASVFVLLLKAAASSPTYTDSVEFILSDSLLIYLHLKLLLDNSILSLFRLKKYFLRFHSRREKFGHSSF